MVCLWFAHWFNLSCMVPFRGTLKSTLRDIYYQFVFSTTHYQLWQPIAERKNTMQKSYLYFPAKKKLLGGRKRPTPRSDSVSSTSTTISEREFRTKYRSLQKTRILRNESTAEDSAKARKSNNVQRGR